MARPGRQPYEVEREMILDRAEANIELTFEGTVGEPVELRWPGTTTPGSQLALVAEPTSGVVQRDVWDSTGELARELEFVNPGEYKLELYIDGELARTGKLVVR